MDSHQCLQVQSTSTNRQVHTCKVLVFIFYIYIIFICIYKLLFQSYSPLKQLLNCKQHLRYKVYDMHHTTKH